MKHLKILFFAALALNVVTYCLLYYHNLQPALQIPLWDVVCSILFYLLLFYALTIFIIKRKELFAKGVIVKSLLVFLLCTPAPLYVLSLLTGQIAK
jgi:hypothetical protein